MCFSKPIFRLHLLKLFREMENQADVGPYSKYLNKRATWISFGLLVLLNLILLYNIEPPGQYGLIVFIPTCVTGLPSILACAILIFLLHRKKPLKGGMLLSLAVAALPFVIIALTKSDDAAANDNKDEMRYLKSVTWPQVLFPLTIFIRLLRLAIIDRNNAAFEQGQP